MLSTLNSFVSLPSLLLVYIPRNPAKTLEIPILYISTLDHRILCLDMPLEYQELGFSGLCIVAYSVQVIWIIRSDNKDRVGNKVGLRKQLPLGFTKLHHNGTWMILSTWYSGPEIDFIKPAIWKIHLRKQTFGPL